MAYIPDEWVMGNIEIAPSTLRLLFYYCGRADQDSGQTNVSAQRASQDLGIRKDHIDEHDRKLVRARLIRIEGGENGGRIVRLSSPWQPRGERNGKPAQRAEKKAGSQDLGKKEDAKPQNLGNPLNGNSPDSPKLGQSPQDLGEVPQNLGKSPQNLGAHIGITSPCNQPIEPEREIARVQEDSEPPQQVTVADTLPGPNDDFDTPLPERKWTMGERFILKACELWEKPILETDWKLCEKVRDFGKWVEERVDPKKGKGGRPEYFQEFWFKVLNKKIAPRPDYLIEQWDAYDRWLVENYETHRQGVMA